MVSALCAFKAALPWGDYLLLCQHVHATDAINELEKHVELKKPKQNKNKKNTSSFCRTLCEAKRIRRGSLKFQPCRPPALSAAATVAWERRSLPNGRGLQAWPQRLRQWWVSVCCCRVSWPHHSRQPDQRLWHRGGIIKGLGGRGQQPDVALRFPSSTGWGKDTGLRKKRSDPLRPIPISSGPIRVNWKGCISLIAPHFTKHVAGFSGNARGKKQNKN